MAVQAARHGVLAIAPTTRGFEPAAVPDINGRHGRADCRSQLVHCLLAGRTAMGERVWDMERLIDWAAGLPEVDSRRILMMGNSGGGMVTIYAAACDTRIAVAVPSCSFCTLVGQTGLVHHCDCNAVPGIGTFGEFYDVAGLIAPRHLLVVNGREDPLFELAQELEEVPPESFARGATAEAAEEDDDRPRPYERHTAENGSQQLRRTDAVDRAAHARRSPVRGTQS